MQYGKRSRDKSTFKNKMCKCVNKGLRQLKRLPKIQCEIKHFY